jgi:hypothetical protein
METITNTIDPKEFFDRFVKNRRPVLINGHLTDSEWKGDRWTNEYLVSKAGDMVVKVERKKTEVKSTTQFGNGSEERMTFKEFLNGIQSSDGTFYLTTQELDYNQEERPSLLSAPVTGLVGDFPWNPKIMGNLILQNANVWMGCADATGVETTSGLHHDYHDNLYVVIRGTKRLVLFSPDQAHNLYTVGKIEKIHSNGRINYSGQPTLADGSAVTAVKAAKACKDIIDASRRLEVTPPRKLEFVYDVYGNFNYGTLGE